MFAIYTIEGRRFRDTLENLRKVRETHASRGMQLQSNVPEDETQPIPGTASGESGGATVSSKAMQAYKEKLHLNQREPIYHAHQLMSHPVSTVEMDILAARRYFQQQGFQQMPVIDAQQRLVGMLSIENLLQFIIIDGDQVQYLRGKREQRAVSRPVKWAALLYLWLAIGVTVGFYLTDIIYRLLLLVVAAGVTLHLLRLKTLPAETVNERSERQG